MSYDPPKPPTSLGASLASRFAHTSAEKAKASRKKFPRNKTAVCTITTPMHTAMLQLANRRGVSVARLLEAMLAKELTQEGIAFAGEEDDDK